MDRPPQIERLLARLHGAAAPVVQVWGAPGSGRAELLAALLADAGPEARALAPEEVRVEVVRAAVAEGFRWLVVPTLPAGSDPEELVSGLAQAVPADRRLVFAAARRVAMPDLLGDLIGPRELALGAEEVRALARQVGARDPGREGARRLSEAADGWYRPLRLAAERAAADGVRLPQSVEELAAVAEVADFVRALDLELSGRGAGGRSGDPEPEPGARLVRAVLDREAPRPSACAAGRGEGADPGEPPAAGASGAPPALAEDDPAVRFRLHLLGRPEVWRRDPDGWRRLHWPLKRAFRALAFLASEPERRASLEELVEALWSGAPEEVVARNLHPTLSHLRRGLRLDAPDASALQPLTRIDGVYGLAPELGWWIDLEEVVRLDDEGSALAAEGRDREAGARWRTAWRLYRGHFLEGTYEPWVLARREGFQRRHLRLLERLAAAEARLGRLPEAVDAYRAALVEDPLRETAHAALMDLYARLGRRDLVRRQYERLSTLLRAELGVEPMPETTRELHRLMTAHGGAPEP